jgi:hypothetical protein
MSDQQNRKPLHEILTVVPLGEIGRATGAPCRGGSNATADCTNGGNATQNNGCTNGGSAKNGCVQGYVPA